MVFTWFGYALSADNSTPRNPFFLQRKPSLSCSGDDCQIVLVENQYYWLVCLEAPFQCSVLAFLALFGVWYWGNHSLYCMSSFSVLNTPLLSSRCLSGLLNGNIGSLTVFYVSFCSWLLMNAGVMKTVMGELTDSTNRAQAFPFMSIVWAIGVSIAYGYPFTFQTSTEPTTVAR